MTPNLKSNLTESQALLLTNRTELTKRQYSYFVKGKRTACDCSKLEGFMIKFDCGSPFV
ncbi:hypothetical protein LCGC14_0372910 [marine sediment metagenome]|uniref:Uncharacterized protein n=1 Tax=marine sediment metagenome TaxID=412755 RepID=A0A0F9T521_9ZZZZ